MSSASTTATTETAKISAQDNVHYSVTPGSGITFQVSPHSPTAR